MTVQSTPRRAGPFTGNGVTTQFPFTFKVFKTTDVQVSLLPGAGGTTVLTQDSDYSVTLNADQENQPGGTVTYPISGTALASTDRLSMLGSLPYDQTFEPTPGGNFAPKSVENAFDRAVIQIQQVAQQVESSVRAPAGEVLGLLPQLADRANKILGFDGSGNPTTYYGVDASSAAGLALDLANATSGTKGAGQVGYTKGAGYPAGSLGAALDTYDNFSATTNYGAGSTRTALQDSAINVLWYLSPAQRAQVLADGATLDLTASIQALISLAIAAGHRPLYFPAGTYSVSTLDVKGYYGGFVGDGFTNDSTGGTVIKARTTATTLIDAADPTDVIISPLVLESLEFNGGYLVSNIVTLSHRHLYRFANVLMQGASGTCLSARDSWNNTHFKCVFRGAPVGVNLVGSNHRNAFYSCAFTTHTQWGLKVGSAGSLADGNQAIHLVNCDIESADVGGGGILFDGSTMTLDCCYTGENINGPVLQVQGGNVTVNGGVFYYGYTANSIGCQCNGGLIILTGGVGLSAQTNGSFRYLAVGAGGKVRFVDVRGSTALGGTQYMIGDPLDFGPSYPTFAKRFGRNMTSAGYSGGTRSELISANDITATCTAPGGMSISGLLTQVSPEWQLGASFHVVVYIANADFQMRFSGGAGGASPLQAIGTMPNTGGAIWTFIKLGGTLVNNTFDRIEWYKDDCVASPTATQLKILKNITADGRMLGARTDSTFSNLYLC